MCEQERECWPACPWTKETFAGRWDTTLADTKERRTGSWKLSLRLLFPSTCPAQMESRKEGTKHIDRWDGQKKKKKKMSRPDGLV